MNNNLISLEERKQLLERARAATAGPWQVIDFDGDQKLLAPADKAKPFIANLTGDNGSVDAAYLAALDPAKVIDYIGRIETLAAAVASYQCGHLLRPWAPCTRPLAHHGNHVSEPHLRAEEGAATL